MQSNLQDSRIVLGIDPGYERLGISIVEKPFNKNQRKEVLVYSACVRTSSKLSFPDRLVEIGMELERVIEEFGPKELAIENLFLTMNQKTAMHVAETRGLILYISRKNNLSINEYTPMQIKTAITGYGGADKRQMTDMIPKLIKVDKEISLDDEYDAIAVALTHLAYIK